MLGGKNKFAMLAMLKSEGFRLGSSDLVIVLKEKVLFVEIKTETGKQSDNQKEFQRDVEALGYEYLLWKSVDDCLKYFKT